MALRAHLVARHHWPGRIAEQARMHPGEMPEVGEVLHLTSRVAAPRVGPGGYHRPASLLQSTYLWQRPARLIERDPDQAVTFLHGERLHPGLGWHPGRISELRNRGAAAIAAVPPAVVGADEFVAAPPAERQRRPPGHPNTRYHPLRAVLAPPQHQRLAQ